MSNSLSRSVLTLIFCGATASMALAEPKPASTLGAGIDRTQARQDQMIESGTKKGSLSAEEVRRLEHREAQIKKMEEEMRAKNGGQLTEADRIKLNKALGQQTEKIHQFDQTGTVAPSTGSTAGSGIDRTQTKQDEMIRSGAQSGALSPEEVRRLEHRKGQIDKMEAEMRARNNGQLTEADRTKLNKALEQESQKIHQFGSK